MENKLIISEIVKQSWQYLKTNIWVLIGLFVGYLIVATIIQSVAQSMLLSGSMGGYLIAMLVLLVVQVFYQLGYFKMILDSFKGIEPSFAVFGQQAGKFVNYLIAGLLVGLIVIIGLIFLVLPGIFLALRLQYANLIVIEENAGPIEAMEKSWNLTKGKELELFLLCLVYVLILIGGVILLGIGVLVATPLTYVCYCYVYTLLKPADKTSIPTEGYLSSPAETL